jgi:hypothetical protein
MENAAGNESPLTATPEMKMFKSLIALLALVRDTLTGAQGHSVSAFRVGSYRVVVRPQEWANESLKPESRIIGCLSAARTGG